MAWQVTLDADEADAVAVLAEDRVWNSFALADLTPPFRAYSQIAIAIPSQPSSSQAAACLILRQPGLSVVSPYGAVEGVAVLLSQLAARHALPDTAFIQARWEHLPPLQATYLIQPDTREMLRMAVTAGTFLAPPTDAGRAAVERLSPDDAPALAALYALYPENHFRADQLQQESFFGVRSAGRLVAAAGTHVVAPAYGVVVLGNIFTHPDVRGRGYARAVTSTLVTSLFARGCGDVILNVAACNTAAIRLYVSLGFRTHTAYWMGPARSRSQDDV